MVNLVIVSHSSRLGEGVGELARQMLMSDSCKIAIAAGIDDPQNPIGTDAVKVMEAIESVADADHVLVMMDMGSALLSAETALELLAPEIAAKVRLCAAPLVEGTLAATVSAASGAEIDKVIFDAMHALEAKREQLGLPSSNTEISDTCPAYDEEARSLAVVIKNRNGLHVRPASRLVYTLSTFNADMLLEKNGKCVTPESINQIALLQVRYNDTLRLIAKGPEAEEALIAFRQLAEDNFGETEEVAPPILRPVPPVSGKAFYYQPVLCTVQAKSTLTVDEEQERLRQAIDFTLLDLMTLTAKAEASGLDDIAAIFSGHHTLLDDPELLAAADLVISRAGALTLAELEAVGRAAVLIPSPNVAENHQYFNAMELQKADAAVVIEEKDLTGEKLVSTVSDMLAQPGKLAEMGKNARSLSVDDSLDRIADALMKLVQK